MTDQIRRFLHGRHSHSGKDWGLEKTLESLSVMEPRFIAGFFEAVLREGAEELTLRREDEGTQRTFRGHHECGRQ